MYWIPWVSFISLLVVSFCKSASIFSCRSTVEDAGSSSSEFTSAKAKVRYFYGCITVRKKPFLQRCQESDLVSICNWFLWWLTNFQSILQCKFKQLKCSATLLIKITIKLIKLLSEIFQLKSYICRLEEMIRLMGVHPPLITSYIWPWSKCQGYGCFISSLPTTIQS